MKYLKFTFCAVIISFLSACSLGYNVVIINDSNQSIEIHYKTSQEEPLDEPMIKSLKDWNDQKSIKRFWTEEKPWQNLEQTEYETNLETRERTIRLAPQQIVQIEIGNYNPVSEEKGELSKINELKIISPNGETIFKGKSLLKQFEKNDYTFSKTYKNEINNENLK